MKGLKIVAVLGLAVVALVAFALATVRRDSEAAMHVFRDDAQFYRERTHFIVVGTAALLTDAIMLWRLCRRPARRDHSAT